MVTKGVIMSNTYLKSPAILGFVMAVLFASCSKNETITGSNQITGSGRLVSVPRAVGTFSGIRVTSFAKVFIEQDSADALVIEADDNIIDRVLTSVDNGVLVVGLQNGSYNNITLNVHASMRSIRLLESVGSADFQTTSAIQTDTIVCRITGAGTVALTGSATREIVEIVGAGNIRNFGFSCSHCFASISGTGNVDVNVTQQLDAFISGMGTITYDGNPPVINQTITGLGTVRRRP